VSGALFARDTGLGYGSRLTVPQLAEDPRIPAEWQSPVGSLFHAGHVIAPWTVFVADAGSQVHVTTARQASPHGAVAVVLDANGVAATWSASQGGSLSISGRALDLSAAASRGGVLELRYRVDRAPEKNVLLGMRCTDAPCGSAAGRSLDLTQTFKSAALGEWRTLSVPLTCLTAAGVDLKDIEAPFALATAGRFGLTITDVRLSPSGDGTATHCP
jgi:beta-glucosidase